MIIFLSVVFNIMFNIMTLNARLYRFIRCWYTSRSYSNMKTCNWDVSSILSPQLHKDVNYAVLILNRPLLQKNTYLKCLWNNATVRLTVDGGTDRWDKFLTSSPNELRDDLKLPDLITGDLDSISEVVLHKYRNKGCKVVCTPDQNYTDFTKALIEVNSFSKDIIKPLHHVIAVGQMSGRIDQILGNIQSLFLAKEKSFLGSQTRLFLMSDDSLSWLLKPGSHIINIPHELRTNKHVWCSLVPIGEQCTCVTTSGLKWDLTNATLRFGDLVSTSNTYKGTDVVSVECSNTLLWSMEIPSIID